MQGGARIGHDGSGMIQEGRCLTLFAFEFMLFSRFRFINHSHDATCNFSDEGSAVGEALRNCACRDFEKNSLRKEIVPPSTSSRLND